MAIVTDILYRGEDKAVVFTLTDKDGNAINLVDLVDAIVVVKINQVEVARYKKTNPELGFEVLAADAANECKVLLTSAQTREYARGLLEIEFVMVVDDDDFPEGRREVSNIPMWHVKDAK